MSVNSNTKFKVIGMTNQSPYLEMSELIEYLENNGLGGGDEPVVIVSSDISDATATGISLLTASSAASARQAIGAGTSNLQIGTAAGTAMAGNTALLKIGTTATDAKAGNYQPSSDNITDATDVGKALIKAATQAAARTAIGAGTSNLALGTTGTTAAAGNHTHNSSQITKTALFEGDTTANVQEALGYLYAEIQALKNPTP